MGIILSIITFKCGKEGGLFSWLTIIGLYNIKDKQKIYKVSYILGCIAFFMFCYLSEGVVVTRYINGNWIGIFKRTNLLYVSFFALLSLRLLIYSHNKSKLDIKTILLIAIVNVLMYIFTGTRTGFLVTIFLIMLLSLLRYKKMQKSKLLKYSCIMSPVICLAVSWFTSYYYEKIQFLKILNNTLAGRLSLGHIYLNSYNLTLFGQQLERSYGAGEYMVLDSAYLDMLLCYGVLFTTAWILLNCYSISFFFKRKKYIEVSLLVVYSVWGITETFLPNIFLNISLFLCGDYIFFKLSKTA